MRWTPRILLWIGLCATLACATARARWEAYVTGPGGTWFLKLERAPLWAPPAIPDRSKFDETFAAGQAPAVAAETPVRRAVEWDWMLLEALIGLWGATGFASVVYFLVRGEHRDEILRVAAWVFFGLTAAAAASVGLWIWLGGWGPPLVDWLGPAGLVVGLVVAFCTRNRRAMTGA